jgi:hypothetical protein
MTPEIFIGIDDSVGQLQGKQKKKRQEQIKTITQYEK